MTERFVAAAMGAITKNCSPCSCPTSPCGPTAASTDRPLACARCTARARWRGCSPRRRGLRPGYRVRYRAVGTDPCAVLFDGNAPLAVVVREVTAEDAVRGMYSVTNPDKLTHIR
ncbi:hypothetical protein [Nocardia amikacinitolerans]|uniref:hypothetical protein n=1 Tax=Nocardia amikacinitolerans TaxID=756689 RepID=UPI000AD348B0|nr:hypothetical protein [Nocardia amikacinitolerans]